MVWNELGGDANRANRRDRDQIVGVFIGIVALILAVCTLGGGNAAKDATMKNIEATNTWAFFQAKNMRRQLVRLQTDELQLMLATQPGLTEAARAAVQAKIDEYKALDARLTSEPATQEGLDELFKRAKALEADRDIALRKDPYFDYGQAMLQIAIVLASVALLSGGNLLIIASVLFAAVGAVLTFNGFTLLAAIPFIG
jgi:Domain of unknown function (DUF4337)